MIVDVMSNAAQAVDEYLEYSRIVGDDDGGKTFSPAEYERYKRDVIPMRLRNRLYVTWTNASGMDCKCVGPETPCFCHHRYKQHQTDFKELPSARPIKLPCRQKGCKCTGYTFVPANVRCSCKHLSEDHAEFGELRCKKPNCKCDGFKSSYNCGCMQLFNTHYTLVETKQERQARGMPVGQDVPYQAMGGITGFSSLLDGYMRMDDSGRGALSKEKLEQPISDNDHAFLRQYKALENSTDQLSIQGRPAPKPSQSSQVPTRSRSKTPNRQIKK